MDFLFLPSPPPHTWGRKQSQLPKCYEFQIYYFNILLFGRWIKSTNPSPHNENFNITDLKNILHRFENVTRLTIRFNIWENPSTAKFKLCWGTLHWRLEFSLKIISQLLSSLNSNINHTHHFLWHIGLCILPTKCIYMFRTVPQINSNYFTTS
jgi:hypothetical protein